MLREKGRTRAQANTHIARTEGTKDAHGLGGFVHGRYRLHAAHAPARRGATSPLGGAAHGSLLRAVGRGEAGKETKNQHTACTPQVHRLSLRVAMQCVCVVAAAKPEMSDEEQSS